MSVLSQQSTYYQLPIRLREKIDELYKERAESGIETTPDETSEVIESLFEHLGRLWMAELWYALEKNQLNFSSCIPTLLGIVEDMQRRSITTGRWVSFCRAISNIFRQQNQTSRIEGLDSIDWGVPGDNGLISKIMDFRNRFAHGSFEAPLEIINEGYSNVDALIEHVPGLWTQSWHVLTSVGWKRMAQDGFHDSDCPKQNDGITLTLKTNDGFMPLTPFFSHSETEDGLEVHLPMWKPTTVEDGLQQEQITAWYQQYRKEYAGLIDRRPTISQRSFTPLSEDQWTLLQPALQPCNQTSLLIGHPGTGLSDILPSIINKVESNNDSQWLFWDVQPSDLTQSATCFVRAIGETLQSGIFADANGHTNQKFKSLSEQLDHLKPLLVNTPLIIAVDGLQYGHISYRFEPHTIIDVCNWMTDMNVTLLLIHHPAENKTPIFFSEQISWPVTTVTSIEELNLARTWLEVSENTLYQNILHTLQAKPECSLFELCDALDAASNDTAPPVFEPEIEYALWHLRPLLTTQIKSIQSTSSNAGGLNESIRVWSNFSHEVAQ